MNDYYNDKEFSYDRYWQNRNYEHDSEVMAINRLLGDKKFANIADIGGGFGRLTKVLEEFGEEITLVEPSEKMRAMAKKYLEGLSNVKIIAGSTENTTLTKGSQNLVISVRVMHHLTDLSDTISEFSRITKPNGLLILEFANSLNIKARIRSLITGKPIMLTSVDLRSQSNIKRQSIAFVNHHPDTVVKLLTQNKFLIKNKLSVSNFRSPFLKKILPTKILIVLEYLTQNLLSKAYFGPSIFILAQRVDI